MTVTHPDMVRYFMTIGEACDLVVTAAGHALGDPARSASVYVLNMGQPVRIAELAERMIRLPGLEPGVDIEIAYTGVRPGERLHETLFAHQEPTTDVGLAGVLAARHPVSLARCDAKPPGAARRSRSRRATGRETRPASSSLPPGRSEPAGGALDTVRADPGAGTQKCLDARRNSGDVAAG